MDQRRSDDSELRFAAYVEGLARVIGHKDREGPLRDYCTGLLMPCERKSVEPMAAITAPHRTAAQHQSLLHFVDQGEWSDEPVLAEVREMVLPQVARHEAIEAWIIDDTSFPKQGNHSVGVHHQYCGQLGKQANCQVAVTLSIANHHASLPVAYQLYLPQDWAEDRRAPAQERGSRGDRFKTKPQIALSQLRGAGGGRAARRRADGCELRQQQRCATASARWLNYAAAIARPSVWAPGTAPLRRSKRRGRGRRERRARAQASARSSAGLPPKQPGAPSPGAKARPHRSPRALPACGCAPRPAGAAGRPKRRC